MFNFSSNNLIWLLTKYYDSYNVHIMKDTDTKRCYRIHDFRKEMKLKTGEYYCISGKVNSADRIYLVAEKIKVKQKIAG